MIYECNTAFHLWGLRNSSVMSRVAIAQVLRFCCNMGRLSYSCYVPLAEFSFHSAHYLNSRQFEVDAKGNALRVPPVIRLYWQRRGLTLLRKYRAALLAARERFG